MRTTLRFPRQARWAVPFGAVAVVGIVAAGSVLTSAQAAPALPPRTPAQLIAAIAANKSVPSALSGTIVTNAALGLPDLPAAAGPAGVPSVLTGSHTFEFWYARPQQLRLAVPVPLGETDLRVDGRQVWLWDSKTNTATHIELPADPGPFPPAPGGAAGAAYSGGSFYSPNKARTATASATSQAAVSSAAENFPAVPTPQQAAQRLLAMLGPTTTVSAASNVMIAGQAAYQLVLAPKNPGSLIGRVSIAIDASKYLPLRVQIFARGSARPAFQIGFTSISFARPAASNFTFTPPPGAKVKTAKVPAGPAGLAGPLGAMSGGNGGGFIHFPGGMAPAQVGAPGSSISVAPGLPTGNNAKRRAGDGRPAGSVSVHPLRSVIKDLPKGALAGLPKGALKGLPKSLRAAMRGMPKGSLKGMTKSQRQQLIKLFRSDARTARLHPGVGRHGAGWYAYAPTTGGMFPSGVSAPRVIGSGWMAVGVFPAGGLTGSPGGVPGALLRSATPVHGSSWGSGRLLRTSLFSVLITSNGKALIGAVAPSVLYAAAAQAK
jgi:outer membrane lipoprotein-sorting protein